MCGCGLAVFLLKDKTSTIVLIQVPFPAGMFVSDSKPVLEASVVTSQSQCTVYAMQFDVASMLFSHCASEFSHPHCVERPFLVASMEGSGYRLIPWMKWSPEKQLCLTKGSNTHTHIYSNEEWLCAGSVTTASLQDLMVYISVTCFRHFFFYFVL